MKRDLLLWLFVLVPPAVWFVTLLANFALAPIPCASGGVLARRSVSLAALLINAAATLLAFLYWRRVQTLHGEGAPVSRVRAMSIAAIVLGGGFALVIIAQSLPDFLMTGCE
jgi:hypothetical protein